MEKIYVSSTGTQTEQLTSPILWHCLHVVKSVHEFKGLSYRITTDIYGNELLIISRDQVIRVFGPPVEPISLTLDPNGKCLLSIPFRPVQHVPVTKSKTGHLEITSLHALLTMVAGKGFCFCPGIPGKFLAGRACGKYISVHRTPFKRFNAVGCPIYFKLPKTLEFNSGKDGQLTIRTLCPRCRQVAKWAQTLPISQNTKAPSSNVNRAPPQSQTSYPTPSQNPGNSALVASLSNPIENKTLNRDERNISTSISTNPLQAGVSTAAGSLPLTVVDNGKAYSNSGGSNNNNNNSASIYAGKHVSSGLDGGVSANVSKRQMGSGMNSEKLQAVSDSLRQLLRERSLSREGSTDLASKYRTDGKGQNRGEKSPGSSRPRSPRGNKSKKNVCHICFKQFSSNLRLSKHVQRHEGNASNLSQVLRRKIQRRKSSSSLLNRLFHGVTSQSSNLKKRNSPFSEWSLQLMLNSLDNLLLKEVKKKGNAVKTSKGVPEKKRNKRKRKVEEPALQQPVENLLSRPGVRRTGSGLAALQTLLNAAQMADGEGATSVSSGNITNFSVQNGSMQESFSSLVEYSNRDTDSPSQAKKARTSSRLASKRANKKSKSGNNTPEPYEANDLPIQSASTSNPHHPTDESIMLTNLNLLSTVSLQAELRDNQSSPGLQLLSIAGNLDSKINNPTHNPNDFTRQSTVANPPPNDSLSKTIQNLRARQNQPPLQIPTTIVSHLDSKTNDNNKGLPPIPPLILGTDSVLMNSAPHSSTTSPLAPLPSSAGGTMSIRQQLNNTQKTFGNATPGGVNLLPHEDVLGSNCGAMDLSKPKSFPTVSVSNTSASSENASPVVSQDSTDVLRHFLAINPLSMQPQQNPMMPPENSAAMHDPRVRLLSSKDADDSLQARMFASAKKYKVDPSKFVASGHLQAAIVAAQTSQGRSSGPSTGSGTPAKQAKGKDKANLPVPLSEKSEIQCGYKWSGSGGLVKERTQLVRELVPSMVMANILNGPGSHSGLLKMDDPISAPMQNITKLKSSEKLSESPQVVTKSFQPPISLTSQQQPLPSAPAPQPVTLRPREAPVRPKTPQYVLNLSKNRNDQDAPPLTLPTSAQLHNKPSPGSFPTSILKTSLLNTPSVLIPTSMFSQKPLPLLHPPSITGIKRQPSSNNTSVMAPLRNTVLATLNPPTPQVVPNSSLASILRHSPNQLPTLSVKGPDVSYSIQSPSNMVAAVTSTSNASLLNNAHQLLTKIKTEPADNLDNGNGKLSTAERNLSTPPNLVVDMSDERIILPGSRKLNSSSKTNSIGKVISKGKVSIVNAPLKCEYCSQVFPTAASHDYHVCPKKP